MLDAFDSLKGEVDTDMAMVHEILDRIRSKIRANALNEQNPNGLLTGDL